MSRLVVTEAADDLQLLTIEEMRALAGETGGAMDEPFTALGLRVASSIASECNITAGIGGRPTLRRETLTETFRGVRSTSLYLARRHDVEITSITEDDAALDGSEYEVEPESGLVTRLSGDCQVRWCASKVVVVYEAGFDDIPHDLKQAAMDCFRAFLQETGRDPLVKSEEIDIDGIERRKIDYWVGAVPGKTHEGAVPDVVAGQLTAYRNFGIG